MCIIYSQILYTLLYGEVMYSEICGARIPMDEAGQGACVIYPVVNIAAR